MQQLAVAVLLLSMSLALAASGDRCDSLASNGAGWIRHSGSCYRWTESPDYWYEAEQVCKADDGHLVSIGSPTENTLVGRLTYCKAAWTGRYGTHADKLTDPNSYRWTDGSSAVQFQRHNFSRVNTPHQPLVTAEDLQWHNNLYHERQTYVCKAPAAATENASQINHADCPTGWYNVGEHCYMQPNFKATYIEADFYCSGRQAHLVSVHTESELRLLSLLDLTEPVCSIELWLGLVKLNPCRIDYFKGRKQSICYRWADRSGDYRDFPAWARGNPNDDLVTNCVLLRDRDLYSAPCHLRRNFICKRPKSVGPTLPPTQRPTQPPTQWPTEPSTQWPTQPPTQWPTQPPTQRPTQPPSQWPTQPPTQRPTQPPTQWPTQPPTQWPTEPSTRWPTQPPTQPPQPSTIQAAYDFRRSVSPGNNLAKPGSYPVLNWGDAALVGGARGALLNGSRGIQIDTENGSLTRQLKHNRNWTIFYYVQRPSEYDSLLADVSGPAGEPGLALVENPRSTDLSMYNSAGYFRDESDPAKDSVSPAGLRGAVVMSSTGRATFYRNGADASMHTPATSSHRYPDHDSLLLLGNAFQSALPGYRGWLACFGVAHSALTRQELAEAFQRYCP